MDTLPNYIPEQNDLEVADLNIDKYIYETADIIAKKIIESPDNLSETAFHYLRKLLTNPNSPISNNEKLVNQLIRLEFNEFNNKLKTELSINETNSQNLVPRLVKLLIERIINAITPEITDIKGSTIYLYITTPTPDLTLKMTISNILKSEFDILIKSIEKAHKLISINHGKKKANELIIRFTKENFSENDADYILDQFKYSIFRQTKFGGEIKIVPKPSNPTNIDLIHVQNSIIITDPTLSEMSQLHTLIANAKILAILSQEKQQVDYYKLVDCYVSLAIIYHNQKNPKLASDAINTAKEWATKFSITHPALKELHKDLSLLNPTEIGLRLPPRAERRPATITSVTFSVPPTPKPASKSPTTISPTIKKLILAAGITALGISIGKTANTPAEPLAVNSIAKDIEPTTPIPPVTPANIIEAKSDNTPPTPPVDDISFTLAEADTTIPPTAQINNDPSFTIEDTHTLTIAHKGLIPALKETYGLTALQLGKLYRHPSIFKGTQSFANFLKIIAEANIEQFASVDLNSMPALIKQFEERDTLNLPQLIIDLIEEVKNNEDFPLAIPQTDEQIEAIQQKQHKATSKEISQDTSIETDAGWFDINIDPVSPIENIFAQTEQEIQDTIASTPLNLATENTTTTAETDEEWNTFDATARMDEITQTSTPPAIPKAKGFWSKVKEKAKSWFG